MHLKQKEEELMEWYEMEIKDQEFGQKVRINNLEQE